MKLWLLRPREDLPKIENSPENPWEPWYDKAFGFVVRAETEAEARDLVEDQAGTECWLRSERKPWQEARYSTCEELKTNGEPGVILRDFRSA